MRYATVVIADDEGGLQPADAALTADPEVTRDAIHQVNLLSDDTCVSLYGVRGTLARAAKILAGQPDVIGHDVSGDREGLAYIHFRPTETVHRLLSIVQDNEIVLETPIHCIAEAASALRSWATTWSSSGWSARCRTHSAYTSRGSATTTRTPTG